MKSKPTKVISVRYEENNDAGIETFGLRTFNVLRYPETPNVENIMGWDGMTTPGGRVIPGFHAGMLHTRPEWLVEIVNLGKMGDWGMYPPHPPPGFILWFDLDMNGDFLTFTHYGQ